MGLSRLIMLFAAKHKNALTRREGMGKILRRKVAFEGKVVAPTQLHADIFPQFIYAAMYVYLPAPNIRANGEAVGP